MVRLRRVQRTMAACESMLAGLLIHVSSSCISILTNVIMGASLRMTMHIFACLNKPYKPYYIRKFRAMPRKLLQVAEVSISSAVPGALLYIFIFCALSVKGRTGCSIASRLLLIRARMLI